MSDEKLNIEEVARVANLARLDLSAEKQNCLQDSLTTSSHTWTSLTKLTPAR